MYMNRLINLVLLVICTMLLGCGTEEPNNDSASGSIYGVITDYATGEPVQNANVQLRPSGETTLTGYDGTYEFLDIHDGNYAITVSKAEYTDLIDDYIIEVRNGRRVRRDVQIEKLPTSIRITDMSGNDISMLDFGSDVSMTTKSFNIFNNGTVTVNCSLVYSCNWISSVSSIPASIPSGQTVPVVVGINRSLLPSGQNSTSLTVTTNNGSAEITIKATSTTGNPPSVEIFQISGSNITATSVYCEGRIQDAKGGDIKDCGFCYSTSPNPSLDDKVIRLGPNTGSFTYTITNLEPNTTYHIRAFATSNLGTGYSSDVSVKTVSGLPTCGETIVSDIAGSIVRAKSSVKATNGYKISEGGFCWSTKRNPTINDQVKNTIYPEGEINMLLYPLQPNTTYWVRSYAKSEMGISYGPEKEFKTAISD